MADHIMPISIMPISVPHSNDRTPIYAIETAL